MNSNTSGSTNGIIPGKIVNDQKTAHLLNNVNRDAVLNLNSAGAEAAKTGLQNDPFSFWKPAEQWRAILSSAIEESKELTEYYLFERYLGDRHRRPPSGLGIYYSVKNVIPDTIRFQINSLAIRIRKRKPIPSWPCEGALLDVWRQWLYMALNRLGISDGWHIGFWPQGLRCCVVLTHDVESPLGLRAMDAIADLEEKHGFRSSWNLPLDQYPIDWAQVARLRARGFEFGAHGLRHDGRLFRSLEDFNELAPKVERIAREHQLTGFRAPSTLRRAEWIASMCFRFDSSFADTDPWEPQPGGTCSLFPFFLGRTMVELPYTLPQDHTLIHLLHRDPVQLWTLKASWISSLGGMILTLTHPDYIGSGHYLAAYEELLKRLKAIDHAWRALPSEVAAWWRRRAALKLHVDGPSVRIEGPDTKDAVAVMLSEEPCAGNIQSSLR